MALLGARWQLDQPDTSAWFASGSAEPASVETELQRRYAEALWLGEFHTSLDDFLDYSAQWEHLDTPALTDVLTALSTLMLPRRIVRERHSTTFDLTRTAHLTPYEVRLLHNVAHHGPAARVFSADRPDDLAHQWSQAMESREFQLQILLTLFLLQVASRQPKVVDDARDALLGKAGPSSSVVPDTSAKRRRRKLDKPKRWHGPTDSAADTADGEDADDFAWIRRPRKRHLTGMSQDDGDEDVLEVQGGQVLDVDHLSKRLEALTDILCLSQVTAGMASELADLLGETQEATPSGRTHFGSAVRKVAQHDEMDDAQWLCARVVEPRFGATLPRQCALFRSKCFVSLQTGSTPARPARKPRKPSELPPPSGLSHVLEREQAGRIKMMRAKAGGAPSAMLGRGREVDMARRLARSVSAGSGLVKLEPDTSHLPTASQRSFAGILPSSQHRKPLSTQRTHSPEKPALKRSHESTNRLLVLSTPHKTRPGSTRDTPRLLLPETPPSRSSAKGLGSRSASFGGLFPHSRSPSPIAFGED